MTNRNANSIPLVKLRPQFTGHSTQDTILKPQQSLRLQQSSKVWHSSRAYQLSEFQQSSKSQQSLKPQQSSRREVEVSVSSQTQGFGTGQESPVSVGNDQSSTREVWEAPSAPVSPSRRVLYKASDTTFNIMAPATPGVQNGGGENGQVGPHPSFIQVANPYIFEQKLQDCFSALGTNMAKEDRIRLDGVLWIDNVRKALQL